MDLSYLAKGRVLWCALFISVLLEFRTVRAQYRPKWPDPILQREIFVLNLEDGYFGCQVNDSVDFLQLFELSKLCDGAPQCFKGSDELSVQLKCTDRNHCHPKMPKCVNGVCLDDLCYCNDGFGGKGCDLPDENECKYRPCDVFAHCTNTMGSFYCSCFPGYDGDGFTCHDINECEEPALAALCADNAECCNLPGHFVCKCQPGYTGNATESCTDIDECLDPDCCGRGAACQNTPGSFACQCPAGFTGDPAVECWDVDECKENPCGEGAQCTNLPGGYECSCPNGFRGNPTPAAGCVDVDECLATDKPLCGNHANCVNTPGGYFCQCPAGYTGNPRVACVDIDECPHACGPNSVCTNTPGSYACQCKTGFLGDPYFSAGCSDDNECLSPNACGIKADCYNTVGSYQCICQAGHTGNPLEACLDVDECAQSPCGPGAYCTNLVGSYRCECPNKYLPRGSADVGCERAAVDVACARDLECTENADCTEGACRCKAGYQANGIDCVDVDECKTRNICGPYAKCYNSEGSYECECKQGYEKIDQSEKSKCRDINECLFGKFPCGANAKCINSDGGYSCACEEGFIGDANIGCKSPCDGITCGKHSYCQVHDSNQAACMCDQGFTFDPNNIAAGCVDINECDGSHGPSGLCGQGALCTNVPGSHHCYCPAGFTGDPFRYCEDIDECSRRYGLYGQCGSGASCENTLGSYQCSCPAGYTGNPRESCTDVDECSESFGPNGKCGYSAICTNTPGSYSCRCPPGSFGDAFTQCIAEHVCETDDGCAGNAVCQSGKCLCPAPNHGESCQHPCEQLFCGEHAKCELDSNGLPICSCAAGYVGESNSLSGCVDIDECAQKPCGSSAVCRNTPGSFECICPHNFRGDPYSSCDEAEGKEQVTCSEQYPCPANEECISNGRADQCVCRRGYVRDGEQCRDVNECIELSSSPCGMNSFCTNLDGGFVCHCPSGYTGNPYTVCYPDVMRCNKNSECPGNTLCIDDAYHGKHCGCDAPYVREGDYCIVMSRNCSSTYPCPENQECIFTGAGYGFCICPKGFTLDANGHCRDINECSEMNDWDLCGFSAECVNLPGAYECVCAPGFTGNGRQGCTRIYNSCEADSQCSSNERCLRKWCECLPPFIKDGTSCKHPCDWQQCGQNAECVLGSNGTQCQCKPGCSGNPNTGCQDINECTSLLPVDPNGPCGASAICVNILGSYKCECPTDSEGDPYVSGCFGPAKCERDADCPDDTTCDRTGGSCVDTCSSAHCGPNTECISRGHKAQCLCKAGYVGNPDELVNGCISPCADVWCAENAQCIVSSQNQGVCSCSDGFTGNPWSGGGCSPDYSCSASRPCADGQDCVNGLCLESCNATQCGVGAKCDLHTQRCACLPFFIGDPDILCVPPLPMPPICSPGCGTHSHCTYSSPNKCVCNSGYSGNPYRSCTTVPKCENIECGTSATCLEGATSVECVCPAGYHGNPYLGCEDINECLQGNPCGTGANCINVIGSYQCVCPTGTVGNPLYACQPPRPGVDREGAGCKLTETCPRGLICYRGTCTRRDTCTDDSFCAPENACNFVNDEAGYQCVDPCDTTLCGQNAYCFVDEHRASCHCNESFTGNANDVEFGCAPFVPQPLQCESDNSCGEGSVCRAQDTGLRACVDPCENVQCARNAECKVFDRRPECVCSDPGLDGNPYDQQHGCFTPACVNDGNCGEDEICAKISNRKNYSLRECQNVCRGYKCGTNAVCRGLEHKPICECRSNFKGDAYDNRVGCQPAIPTCSDDSSCPDYQACRRQENGLRNCTGVCDHVRCGLNAHCVGRGHQSVCECLPGFIGDAVHGCQKPPQHLCDSDSECLADKKCLLTDDGIRDCVDVCYGQRCAGGTFCVGREHKPVCECLSGYSRLPGDVEGRCAPNICQTSHECREEEVCALTNQGVYDCLPACRGVTCGSNSHCAAREHQAVCECKEGFEGNPDDLNRGCKPKDQCSTDNDCSSTEVCRVSPAGIRVCIDGCSDDGCGPNARCSVSNHFVICTCLEGFSGQPESKAVGCQAGPKDQEKERCQTDTACNPAEICDEGTCILGCRRDSDCTFDKACFNSKCVNPCTVQSPCGQNSECQPVVHRPRCTCLSKYAGNPYDFCSPIPELPPPECATDDNCAIGRICESEKCISGCRFDENCPHDKACINRQCLAPCDFPEACGENAQCTAVAHRPHCSCGAGYTGDSNIKCAAIISPGCLHDSDCGSGSICESGKCIDACRTDDTCPYTMACINRRCQDPCSVFGACGRNALCRPENHRPVCSCPSQFRGDAAVVCDREEVQHPEACPNDASCQFGYICEFGSCVEGCRNDDHCTPDKTCFNRVCKDPCSFSTSCGANTQCVANSHRPVCTCKNGFVGDPHVECRPLRDVRECEDDGDCGNRLICDSSRCVIGCRNNRGCAFEEACINRLCQNPCGFFGVCGRNAECTPSNHTASCACPSAYRGNPNTVCTEAPPECIKDNECLLGQICENSQCSTGCRHDNNCPEESACINGHCQNPCLLSNACGVFAKCAPFQHRPRCECNENYLGNPYVKCEPIPDDYCEVDSACPLGKICENNRCLEGCRNDIHCKFEQACINKVCQNPCNIYGACGVNAVCKAANHDRICSCLPEFTGDPRSLCERTQPPPECTSDPQCPLGQICSNERCIHGCRTSKNCPDEKSCVKNKCINACAVSGACGRGATCTPSDHVAVCNCPSGFRGDPDVECREIAPECRQDDDCGMERICLKQKCIVGCRTHSNCPYDKACVNGFCQSPCDIGGMCGVNTICRAERHEAHCTCSPGYTGDPLRQCTKIFVECEADGDCGGGYVCAHNQCKDINECLKETLPCGPGASCQNLPGWYKCSCPGALVGNAYGPEGCRAPIPVCFHDSDCPNDQKCNSETQECYDICAKSDACGRGAVCKAVDSKAVCECQPGHRGNPYVECSVCDSCARHLDCPGNLLCLGEFCGCPHPYQQQSSFCVLPNVNCSLSHPCPQHQRCIYSDKTHREGYCSCPKGYMMMFDGRCTDVNECEEKPFPCGHGAKCRNNEGSYECECPYGSYGNAYEGGCIPEGPRKECFHDSDCPDEKACLDYTCKDPCHEDHSCGTHALCVSKGHRKECKCKEGYIGNPYESCGPFVECVADTNCPGNLICLHDHSCGCPNDYHRTFDYCIRSSANCTTDNPCPGNEECLYTNNDYGLCVCPRGFRLNADHQCEDINECRENTCAQHAQCHNLVGSYECVCSVGFEGDPYKGGCHELRREPPGCVSDHECPTSKKCDEGTGQCYDPCSVKGDLEHKCGTNAICKTENHESSCTCPPGFEGYPNKVCLPIRECGVTYNCPGNLICLDSHTCGCPPTFFRDNDYCFVKSQNCSTNNPCSPNEECVYTGDRSGFCVCPHGYELLPYGECRALQLCEENNPCAPGAVCKDKPGSYECVCPIDTIGDPYVKGCQPIVGCTTDHDCPSDRECDTSKQCISPCHICGPNAECTVRDHKAICVCTHGKVGEPYNKQIGCFTPPPPDSPPEVRTIPPVQDLQVMCLADGVQVGVQLGGYDGIVYVKGHSNDAACRRLVTSNELDSIDFKVLFGQCGLIHVNGEASFILVVQKHPRLVTYRARAYHIKCVYSTGERTVTLGFNVSMITTSGTIANTGPPPTCLMSICTLEGKEISSAEIGDDLLLKVDVQPDFIYGGFARSCVAKTMEDEGEFQYEVTDANGCATDPSIFGNWEYDPHQKTLMARFNAFKFPSSNNLRFQCNIRVCFGSCPPVNCDGVDAYGRRRRRQVREEDLVLTDSFKEGALREEIMVQSNAILTFEKRDPQPSQPIEGPRIEDIDHVCLPKLGLILSMIITTLLALVAVAVAISCWLMAYRRRPKRQGPLPHPPDFPNPLYTTPEPVAEPSPDYYPTSHHSGM